MSMKYLYLDNSYLAKMATSDDYFQEFYPMFLGVLIRSGWMDGYYMISRTQALGNV